MNGMGSTIWSCRQPLAWESSHLCRCSAAQGTVRGDQGFEVHRRQSVTKTPCAATEASRFIVDARPPKTPCAATGASRPSMELDDDGGAVRSRMWIASSGAHSLGILRALPTMKTLPSHSCRERQTDMIDLAFHHAAAFNLVIFEDRHRCRACAARKLDEIDDFGFIRRALVA